MPGEEQPLPDVPSGASLQAAAGPGDQQRRASKHLPPRNKGHAGYRCDGLMRRHHMVPQTGPEQRDNLMIGPKYTQANSSQGVQRTPGAQLGTQGIPRRESGPCGGITATTMNAQHGPKGLTWDPRPSCRSASDAAAAVWASAGGGAGSETMSPGASAR